MVSRVKMTSSRVAEDTEHTHTRMLGCPLRATNVNVCVCRMCAGELLPAAVALHTAGSIN